MGRLSDALKRAAEHAEQQGTTVPVSTAEPLVQDDWVEDIEQAFPVEQHRVPAVEESGDAWAFGAEDAGGPVAHAEPVESAAPAAELSVPVADDLVPAPSSDPVGSPDAASLFHRLDLRYARKVVVDDQMMPASREQYRRLAAALHHAQAANGIKIVMIASAVSGEGKTLTASNLALTLSESYRRNVLLIDGDLRKPSLHTLFRVTGTPGLSEGLAGSDGVRLPLRQISSKLTLLTAGAPSGDPMAGLTSPRMRRLVDEARQVFDWVIIDTSPIGLLTDASLLSAMVDCVLMVVKAGSTPFELVRRAMDALGPERIAGVVLNHADAKDQPYGASYQYGYGYGGHLQAGGGKS
jgi:capsular exopolysaccharide synthesis family protein